jgi:hypothetical protein
MVLTVFLFNWRVLLYAYIIAIFDEDLSDFTLIGDRSVCLCSLVNMTDFPISLSLSDLILYTFFRFLRVLFRAEGPPTSITLLMPWGSNLMTLDNIYLSIGQSTQQLLQ